MTGGGTTGYHSCSGVIMSHSPSTFRMGGNETGIALFSPSTFKVGMSNGGGIHIGIHVGKGDSKFSEVVESRLDVNG